MNIVLTAHATEMAAERAIKEAWIRETLHSPTRVENDPRIGGRKRAFRRIPEFGNRWLRVAYVEETDVIRVLTAFFDRRAGG